MATPTPSWNPVRVYGRWRNLDGTLKAGTYKVTLPVRITNSADDVIIPAGVLMQGALQTASGTAPSLDVQVPATDDPDNLPQNWQIQIDITFADGSAAETYRVAVPLALGTTTGLNLRTVLLPQTIPTGQILIAGIPGGLAELDVDGDVVDADGVKVVGGGSTGPVTTAQITDYTEATQDLLNATIVTGGTLTKTYNDAAGTLTLSATGATSSAGITDFAEAVDDRVAALVVAGNGVTKTYDDTLGQLTIAAPAVDTSGLQAQITALQGALSKTDANAFYTGSTYPLRASVTTDTTRRVRWIGPISPPIGNGYSIADFDVHERPA